MTVYLAAGGPGDLIAASALAGSDPGHCFVTFFWKRTAHSSGHVPSSSMLGVDRGSDGRITAANFRVEGRRDQLSAITAQLTGSVHLLDLEDLSWSRSALARMVAADSGQEIVVVDTGGDLLGEATHRSLRSPLLEALSLRLVLDCELLVRTRVVIAGLGLDNELSQQNLSARLAHIPHRVVVPRMNAEDVLTSFAGVQSETSRLWLSAVAGTRGRVWTDGTGRPVSLNVLSAAAYSFPLAAVGQTMADAVRSRVADFHTANRDLVTAGFRDELAENAARAAYPSSRARADALAAVAMGDLVTPRFAKRFGVRTRFGLVPINALLSRTVPRENSPDTAKTIHGREI